MAAATPAMIRSSRDGGDADEAPKGDDVRRSVTVIRTATGVDEKAPDEQERAGKADRGTAPPRHGRRPQAVRTPDVAPRSDATSVSEAAIDTGTREGQQRRRRW